MDFKMCFLPAKVTVILILISVFVTAFCARHGVLGIYDEFWCNLQLDSRQMCPSCPRNNFWKWRGMDSSVGDFNSVVWKNSLLLFPCCLESPVVRVIHWAHLCLSCFHSALALASHLPYSRILAFLVIATAVSTLENELESNWCASDSHHWGKVSV